MFFTEKCDDRIIKATNVINELFKDREFKRMIKTFPEFDMATKSPDKIESFLEKILVNHSIEISTYRPWYWRSKAYAMFSKRTPNKVFLSSRRLHRYNDELENLASLVGSIAHEFVHLVDNKFPNSKFGHGSNNPRSKENTAPYKIGAMAKWYVMNNKNGRW